MHSERVTYLSTADQKAALEAFAKSRGESVGNVVREATARYIGQPSEKEEAELAALVEQVNDALPKMRASIDESIGTLSELHQEMDSFLREKGIRK